MLTMLSTGDWSRGATPMHFAALYVTMHERVYSMRPDLTVKDYRRVAMFAGMLLGYEDNPRRRGAFAGDVDAMIRYSLWLWHRERERDEWRQRAGRERRRLIPQVAFSRALVDDWRVSTRQG